MIQQPQQRSSLLPAIESIQPDLAINRSNQPVKFLVGYLAFVVEIDAASSQPVVQLIGQAQGFDGGGDAFRRGIRQRR